MRRMTRLIAGGYTMMMVVILAVVLLFYGNTQFDSKKYYFLSQGIMLALGLGGLALCTWLARRNRAKLSDGARRAAGLLFWTLLFCMQAVLCFHAYFLTDWDVKSILESAYAIAGGDTYIEYYYYYLHPNNAVITLLFAGIMKLFRMVFYGAGLDRCVFALIVFQCALNTLTGMLTARVARRLTGSDAFAALAAVIYAAFIGLSPWLMIPYSDSICLVFPIAILAIYESAEGKRGIWQWLCISLLTMVGYLIKPQVVIVTIAIVMLEAVRLLARRRAGALLARVACILVIAALGVGPGFDYMIEVSPIKDGKGQLEVGFLHYLMLGLNEETNGSFYLEDLHSSMEVTDPQERTAMQLRTIRERITGRNLADWAEHLKKKTLTNYADGSFAWGIEGVFFVTPLEDKDDVLSPFLKDLVNTDDGKNSPYLSAYFQTIWIGLLAGSLLAGCVIRALRGDEKKRRLYAVVLLAIVGLSLFEWIFEARARYLMIYAPFYLLAGLCGLWYAPGIASKGARSA